MHTILPVTIVLSLGAGSGLVLRRWLSNPWIASILAGIAATCLWGLGMEAMFRLWRPPDERGATHYEGILIVFLVSTAASFLVLKVLPNKNKPRPTEAS